MARIALRVYNNEISNLITHGQIEEAVAHCRHILETHPKHVDTYRFLGKAYLEAQHYSDAADILQRVLSSAPGDFTAHVGMSIIREGEDDLDSAIYHMERAFDTQPSNQAIQDELRRLIGHRDGVEPHKIRLTRGALARMYAHGNLYEQAIAELLAALAEHPQRYELQVLLATMYYQSGKKVEAAEICARTLEKLSYCLEANRLLSIILKENGREEDAQIFYQRWVELDPYAAHLSDPLTPADENLDEAITIERLEWEDSGGGFQPTSQPGWESSLGVSIDDDAGGKQKIPDWLALPSDDAAGVSSPPAPEPLPDWKGTAPDVLAAPVFADDSFGEDLFGGDAPAIPAVEAEGSTDWMAALDDDSGSSGNGDGMADFGSQDAVFPSQPDAAEEAQPDWMTPTGESDAAELAPAGSENNVPPDFLDTLNSADPEPAASSGGDDDWITSLQDDAGGGEIGVEDQANLPSPDDITGVTADDTEAIPEFLKEAGWNPSSGEAEEPAAFADLSGSEGEVTPSEDIPDWMQEIAPTEGDAAANQPGGFADVKAEADPDWLQSLQSQEGGESPDWLEDFGQGASATSEAINPPAPGEDIDFLTTPTAPQAEDTLAALTQPDETSPQAAGDTEDWLASLGDDSQTSPEAAEDPGDFLSALDAPSTQSNDDSGLDWLNDLSAEAAQEAALETAPDTAPDTAQEFDIGDFSVDDPLAALAQPDETSPQAAGDTEDWLASLGDDAQTSYDAVEDPLDFLTALDAPTAQSDDESGLDFLTDLGAEADPATAPATAPEVDIGEFPADDPLAALTQPDEVPIQESGDTEEWLASLGGDAQTSFDAAEDSGDLLGALDTPSAQEDDLGDLSADDPLAVLTQPDEVPIQESGDTEEWLASLGGDAQTSFDAAEDSGDLLGALDTPSAQEDDLGDLSADDPLAALTQPDEVPIQESGDTEDWLTSLRQDEHFTEEEPSLEGENGDQSDPATGQSLDAVSLEQEDGLGEDAGLAWLESLAAKQGVAEEELITAHDDRPADTPDWVQQEGEELSDQTAFETEETPAAQSAPTDDISAGLDAPAEDGSGTNLEWLDDISAEAAQEASSEDEQQWLESLRDFGAEQGTDSEVTAPEVPAQNSPPTPSVEEDDGNASLMPDLIQDLIGQTPDPNGITDSPEGNPASDEPVPGPQVTPTHTEEWLPESEIKEDLPLKQEPKKETVQTPQPPPKAKAKTPAKKGKNTPESLIADARQLMRAGSLDEAIDTYGKLIQKGKRVEEAIADIEEALRKHPINVGLWQILGDAYMRLDRLQDALDSYSKAEDLLN